MIGAAIKEFVDGDSRNKLLVVGSRGMGAIKRCAVAPWGLFADADSIC